MATVYPASAHRVMPWKNGGGSTSEILLYPAQAGIDDFAWRISLATIASPGPFSSFPGISRTLALVDGAGVDLHFEAHSVALRPDGQRLLRFAGAAAVHATLVAGSTTDFNVMTRDTLARHSCQIWQLDGQLTWHSSAPAAFLFVQQGRVQCQTSGSAGVSRMLERHDSLLLEQGESCQLQGQACVYAVEFWPQEGA